MQIASAHDFSVEAIDTCLAATARRDPLVIPIGAEQVLKQDAIAAAVDDHVVGVAWSSPVGDARAIEARVLPGFRRRGIGSALLAHLTRTDEELLCGCDAGHPRARRFVQRRGFDSAGVVFFQRWDGELAEVPGAFQTCTLEEVTDPKAASEVLHQAHADAWPPPVVRGADLSRPTVRTRVAWADGQRVGVLAAEPHGDVWSVGGLAVLPEWRGRGIGRALLCDLMREAAGADLGVALRVHHTDLRQQAWTASLGFWTYRSWAYYRRPSPTPAVVYS